MMMGTLANVGRDVTPLPIMKMVKKWNKWIGHQENHIHFG